ncbi:hypothetical protein WAK64_21340 [Bacillus spongiae]|uniref:DUF3139 domain-containing protein n=1 Tax=Bacillus spongiae TaxID=2683610 RepID=A0ABU8HK47_9BACI
MNFATKNVKIGFILIMLIPLGIMFHDIYYSPNNSLELYQRVRFSDNFEEAKELVLDGYEGNFSNKEYNLVKNSSTIPTSVGQVTVLRYEDKTILIETSPGTNKLHILNVEVLPEELRDFFSE